jgi:hypothetical protein
LWAAGQSHNAVVECSAPEKIIISP